MGFNFGVEYKMGKTNKVAYALPHRDDAEGSCMALSHSTNLFFDDIWGDIDVTDSLFQ